MTARRRRGVASILAMMFLVIFGSLAAAMAVVAQGNLRTADSGLKVSRAMSAAETGMVFAARRLNEETSRFVVEEGIIDATFAEELWVGTLDPAEYTVLPPPGGFTGPAPSGVMQAVRDAHVDDAHSLIIEPGDASLPSIDTTDGILLVRPIAMSSDPDAPHFRLRYELLDLVPMIRVTAMGVDGPITRVLQMDFRINKKIEYAVLSPNRIMIGKNVLVEGPLGSLYGTNANELTTENGDPLVMRSDFYFLDATLDADLDLLYAQVALDDADGDSRLRVHHPVEGANIASVPALVDYDGDEYVDDYDLFLRAFDTDPADGVVVYDPVLAAAAGYGALSNEFEDGGGDLIDSQLGRLIDEAVPDRDGDGAVTASDIGLGYRDGVINGADLYAKLNGRLAFAVGRAAWEAEHGVTYQSVVQGPVRAEIEVAPVTFDVPPEELLEITTAMFNDSQSWFETQVAAPSGAGLGGGATADPALLVGDAEAAGTFTAASPATWEAVPFGSAGAYDYYQRPIFDGFTFRNQRIPMGNNALYEDCTFIGVTFIESERDCDHKDWNYAGALETHNYTTYTPRFPSLPTAADIAAGDIVADTRLISNNIRFHNCTFLGSIAGDRLDEYTHWRNKVQITGTTRFYIDPTDSNLLAQPDAAALAAALNSMGAATRTELAKSSILLPGWSVDVGSFDNQQGATPGATPSVNLKGVIIAGILDTRGTANVHGTLLMTFRPVLGAGPLSYGGQADAFNTTIGYFGPADGDDEGIDPASGSFNGFGEIRLRYDPEALLPDGIPWPARMEPIPETYVEGGSL
ncbi:MAG: hypothetical protein GY715_17910 [Planctomycetes bacterium]|nr:hypothetical protein [Planctomycetota bacterium]